MSFDLRSIGFRLIIFGNRDNMGMGDEWLTSIPDIPRSHQFLRSYQGFQIISPMVGLSIIFISSLMSRSGYSDMIPREHIKLPVQCSLTFSRGRDTGQARLLKQTQQH